MTMARPVTAKSARLRTPTPTPTPTPQLLDNKLLASLPKQAKEHLFPHMKLEALPLGKVLYESGDTLHSVYFPTDSIVSLLYVMENGASAEISVVGNEGVVGIAVFMGGENTPSRALVQSAGSAFSLSSQRLRNEFPGSVEAGSRDDG